MKKSVNALIIFTITIYINSINLIEAFECPLSDGFFMDPEDPHWFYHCIGNHPYHFECSGDLVFNVEIKGCDWPTADITRKPSTTTTTTTPGPTEPPVTRTRHVDDTTTVAVVNTETSTPTVSTSTTPQPSTTEASTRGRHELSTDATH